MRQQITGTIVARVFATAMNLLVIMVAGHALGAAGLGNIALVVLGITLIMLPANLVGGGSLVYLVPRVALRDLLKPAYTWAVICAVLAYALLRLVPLVPQEYVEHVCLLAFVQTLYSVHLSVLVGQQRIRQHNITTSVQAITLLLAFLFALRYRPDPFAYVLGSYASFGITLLLGVAFTRWNATVAEHAQRGILRLMVFQGVMVQSANTLQLLSYRMAYWIIERVVGKAALGLYSVGNQLAESAWLVPKSLGLVLYSKVSNAQEAAEQQRLTLTVLKTACACATAVVLVLVLLPDAVYQLAFGAEITGIRPIVLWLAPGIIAMAASQAFAHFFSGTARNLHNLVGSGIGAFVTLLGGLALIPTYHLHGAALTASLAYGANTLYQTAVFMHISGSRFADLWPGKADVERLRAILRRQG